MKTWYVVTALVFALGACLPIAIAGNVKLDEARYLGVPLKGALCKDAALAPFTQSESSAFDGSLVIRLTNEGAGAIARFCLFDASGAKRLDFEVPFAKGERKDVRLEAPPGIYRYRAEVAADGGLVQLGGVMNTEWCLGHTEDVKTRFNVGPAGVSGSIEGDGCIPGQLALGLVGLVASGGSFALGKSPGLGALLLYSRLAKPRLLDSTVRSKVLDLVAREPGIHSRQIVRNLDAADGQTAYHLGVLAREKLLASIGMPGMRHWYVSGKFTPEQMRALASLRDPTRRRVYDAVVANPGASLSDISEAVGVSLPQGSRAARALERAGLIERRAVGRALSLRALDAPGDVYAAAGARARV